MRVWKRIINWLGLSILTTSLIVGCSFSNENYSTENSGVNGVTQSSTAECRVVEHALGATEICGQPQKIVVVGTHILDLLLSLDAQPVGYTAPLNMHQGEIFDHPAQQIPYLGDRITTQPVNLGNSEELSLEALTALKPDLILGEAGRNGGQYELLSQIAPTLLWPSRQNPDQWRKTLRGMAVALGRDERAEAVIQQYEARVSNMRADLAETVTAHPTVLLVAASRLEEGIRIIKPESYLGDLLEKVGFQLIASSLADNNALTSVEVLPELNEADSIIILGFNLDVNEMQETPESSVNKSINNWFEAQQVRTIKQNWETNAIAQSLTASQENRVYFATFYKWNGLNGPIGAELILKELRQFLR